MLQQGEVRQDDDAEREFRRRLSAKLAERGCPEQAIPGRVNELLRRDVGLRLDIAEILRPVHQAPE